MALVNSAGLEVVPTRDGPPGPAGEHRPASTEVALNILHHARADRQHAKPGPRQRHCDGCGQLGPGRVFCYPCDLTYCDACWDLCPPHRARSTSTNALPHEKTDPSLAETIRASMAPVRTEEQQEILHRDDENTIWFGVSRDEYHGAIFQDYNRYAALVAEGMSGRHHSRYPGLVSFVGETGKQRIHSSAGSHTQSHVDVCRGWEKHVDQDSDRGSFLFLHVNIILSINHVLAQLQRPTALPDPSGRLGSTRSPSDIRRCSPVCRLPHLSHRASDFIRRLRGPKRRRARP